MQINANKLSELYNSPSFTNNWQGKEGNIKLMKQNENVTILFVMVIYHKSS